MRRGPIATRERLGFGLTLALVVVGLLHESVVGGKVLSPADILFVTASFREVKGPDYEPLNRLPLDPVLQFQPWLEFSRREVRAGRLPVWNPDAGSGAPHLANGQSAVFDPFHAIAYLGRLPGAIAPMAAARLWFAGFGMFLLAGHWGLARPGRWFAGLVYPLSGFLVAWLLYPVTAVAVWLPWVMLAGDRLLDTPTPRRVGLLALAVGGSILGGHIQTSAHLLIASGLNLVYRVVVRRSGAGVIPWLVGTGLGVGVAAVEVVPLADYLGKSPVWIDRTAEVRPPWAIVRPRLLDAACTALPYAFGSQRRGHPNLARGLGVHNLNESAGGFCGLATLILLAPIAATAWRRRPRVAWLVGLVAVGLLGGFRFVPVDNILRAIPVLNVTDNRRLTLWVSFGLSLLGGIGLDRLGAVRRGVGWAWLARAWLVAAAGCLAVAVGIGRFEARLHSRAIAHYEAAARATPGADPAAYRARADRQTRDTLRFVPRYYALAAAQLVGLAAWLALVRSRRLRSARAPRGAIGTLALVDLLGFGLGLNPAISPEDDRPVTPLIAHLRRVAAPPRRVVGVGEEFPPNLALRYGLADVRNYDSIELTASVAELGPLYPATVSERTSRRPVTWEGVIRARPILERAGVAAVVAASPPPAGAFDRVDLVGSTWVARLDPGPFATLDGAELAASRPSPTRIAIDPARPGAIVVRESSDGDWRVESERASVPVDPGPSLACGTTYDQVATAIVYRPSAVAFGLLFSGFSLAAALFALTRFGPMTSTRTVRRRPGWTRATGSGTDPHHPDPNPISGPPTGADARARR